MVGILNGSLWIWILFIIAYVFFCIYLSFKIYFLSYVVAGIKKFKNDLACNGFCKSTLAPVKKCKYFSGIGILEAR